MKLTPPAPLEAPLQEAAENWIGEWREAQNSTGAKRTKALKKMDEILDGVPPDDRSAVIRWGQRASKTTSKMPVKAPQPASVPVVTPKRAKRTARASSDAQTAS